MESKEGKLRLEEEEYQERGRGGVSGKRKLEKREKLEKDGRGGVSGKRKLEKREKMEKDGRVRKRKIERKRRRRGRR